MDKRVWISNGWSKNVFERDILKKKKKKEWIILNAISYILQKKINEDRYIGEVREEDKKKFK